jgi:hypothetical protein
MANYKEGHKVNGQRATLFAQTYFHGTKANLEVGDLNSLND